MASKKITIFVVPDGTNRIRQLRLPGYSPVFFAVLLVFCLAFSFWIIRDYRTMKAQMPRLAQLEKENSHQKNQFIHLAQRIDQVTQQVSQLNEFDRKLKVMVNLEPGDDEGEFYGVGGSDPIYLDPKHTVVKTHRDLVRRMHRSLNNLDSEISLGEQDKTELHRFLENQQMLLASTPSIWPTKGWLSSRFGYRKSPFTGEREFHKGIDIATRINIPIVAPADGIVSSVSRNRGYGRMLTIKHGYGLVTRYGHLAKALVTRGQHIKRGETIALVGNSGRSTGPHLHYEVHLNKVHVNPMRYILN